MIAKKGVAFLWRLYLRLCVAAAGSSNWPRLLRELVSIASSRAAPRLLAA
jgi:IS5 family transposase